MPEDALRLAAPRPKEDRLALFDLISKTFGGYFAWMEKCEKHYIGHSHYDWEASRVGFADGRLVSHFGVWGYEMRVGAARLKVGGIGAVATDGTCRKRGFMARTASESIRAMRALGYDMSVLFGIQNFYHRFGYVRAWPYRTYAVSAADLPQEPPNPRPARFVARHRDDLAAIYNRMDADVVGSAVRPTYRGKFYLGDWQGWLWKNKAGEAEGYIIGKKERNEFTVAELGGGDLEQGLRAVAALARTARTPDVKFLTLPQGSALEKRLRWGRCRIAANYHPNGGPMIALIDLGSTLKKLEGELAARLRASPMADWRGALEVNDGRDRIVLGIETGGVRAAAGKPSRHAIRGGDGIAQLIIGAEPPEEIAEMRQMELLGDAPALMRALFPARRPMLRMCDQM